MSSSNVQGHRLFDDSIIAVGVEQLPVEGLKDFVTLIKVQHAVDCLRNVYDGRVIYNFFFAQLE